MPLAHGTFSMEGAEALLECPKFILKEREGCKVHTGSRSCQVVSEGDKVREPRKLGWGCGEARANPQLHLLSVTFDKH